MRFRIAMDWMDVVLFVCIALVLVAAIGVQAERQNLELSTVELSDALRLQAAEENIIELDKRDHDIAAAIKELREHMILLNEENRQLGELLEHMFYTLPESPLQEHVREGNQL